MKFNETTRLKIDRIDHKGRGCGKVNDRKACAYFAFPGEEITARLVGRQKGALKMEADEVLTPSPHRIDPPCQHAGQCGGCKWQMIDYDYQLGLKRELVNRELEPVGLPPVEQVIPCPEQFHYRNRMDYAVGWQGEVGLKEPGRWNRYLDLRDCRLLSPETPEIISRFRDWMKKHDLQPWDNKFHRGFVRYLVIREGKNTEERLIMVLTAAGDLPALAHDDLIARLRPLCTGLLHGINERPTDISLADQVKVLHGKQLLTEAVNGRRFTIPVNSFFQTNTVMAGRLVDTVAEMLSGQPVGRLLDLYCGVGLFGICLADRAEQVIGVELDEAAAAVARENAEQNGLTNAKFTAAAAESLIWRKEKPDTVIVDPPRVGLHPKVTETLLANRPPRLIYVSCNYRSLARDWLALKDKYRCTALQALDLFPHGPHVECVARLETTG